MLFCINLGFSGLNPQAHFSQNYFSLVETFSRKLLRLHLIEHVLLSFSIYHLRL